MKHFFLAITLLNCANQVVPVPYTTVSFDGRTAIAVSSEHATTGCMDAVISAFLDEYEALQQSCCDEQHCCAIPKRREQALFNEVREELRCVPEELEYCASLGMALGSPDECIDQEDRYQDAVAMYGSLSAAEVPVCAAIASRLDSHLYSHQGDIPWCKAAALCLGEGKNLEDDTSEVHRLSYFFNESCFEAGGCIVPRNLLPETGFRCAKKSLDPSEGGQ